MVTVLIRFIFCRTKKTIFVSFDVPMQTMDEFFGPKIVKNLASFLNVDEDKILVAYAVREKKRSKRESVIGVRIMYSINFLTNIDLVGKHNVIIYL